jgi:putative FmdB family regulatory protein
MPIYEYECDKCGAVFEAMQAISAKPLKTCKGLGCNDKDNGKVRRLVSASGFILKGSGWYTSEYPSEARKQGWEKDSKQEKPDTPASKPISTGDASPVKTPTPAAPAQAQAQAKKSSAKSPYSGSKSKQTKGSK